MSQGREALQKSLCSHQEVVLHTRAQESAPHQNSWLRIYTPATSPLVARGPSYLAIGCHRSKPLPRAGALMLGQAISATQRTGVGFGDQRTPPGQRNAGAGGWKLVLD